MDTNVVQRWRDGRSKFNPSTEVIDTSKYEVAFMPGDREAKTFVQAHHYSGSFPAARFRYGLYKGGDLVGVAVYSIPCNGVVLDVLPCERSAAVELGRFVLLDDVPGNGESWMLARTFELLRAEGIRGVVSFSDPMPRTNDVGTLVFPGHVGTIYRAINAVYHGRASARTLRLLPNGTVFSERAISKIRSKDQGWRYSVQQLVDAGAEAPTGDLREWLKVWLPIITRKMKHPGNLRYLFPLDKKMRKALPPGLPYVKYVKEPGKPLVLLEKP